jgi:Cu/Zn superoxide dismutase
VNRANIFTVPFFLGAGLLVALSISITVVQETAWAQEAENVRLQLSEVKNSGVSGTADLRDVEDGVEVTLNMQGLPEEGVEHLNHFHGGGRCSDVEDGENVPITIPLDNIVANEDGTGSATTILEGVTLSRLLDRSQDRIILVHDEAYEGEGIPAAIACADVNAPSGDQTAALEESTQLLPKSGGLPVASVLLPATAFVICCGILVYAVSRRT